MKFSKSGIKRIALTIGIGVAVGLTLDGLMWLVIGFAFTGWGGCLGGLLGLGLALVSRSNDPLDAGVRYLGTLLVTVWLAWFCGNIGYFGAEAMALPGYLGAGIGVILAMVGAGLYIMMRRDLLGPPRQRDFWKG